MWCRRVLEPHGINRHPLTDAEGEDVGLMELAAMRSDRGQF
jgi:hypothetical protein